MPSPFPGMNPYLEQDDVWHDFHQRFATAMAETLGGLIAPRYFVKIDEHAYIHEMPADHRRPARRPDAFVAPSGAAGAVTDAVGLAEAPVEILLPGIDVERQPFLEVRDRYSRQVITVIELLSPSNKEPGPDREQYLTKRGEFLASTVNLVEIDLLRGGGRLPPIDLPGADYCVFISRAEQRPRAGAWPVRLQDKLPVIPVPLRGREAEPRLELQSILDRVYDLAYYATYIYSGAPRPPLSPDDAAWARQFVPTSS